MKKTLLLATLSLASAFAFAQKPSSGNKTVETSILLQTGTAPIQFITPNLRLRYFITNDLAARVSFLYESTKLTENFIENQDGTGGKGSSTIKSSSFTFAPGIEKHFKGVSRLSPYMGGVFGLTLNGASEEWENSDGDSYEKDVKATFKGVNSLEGFAATIIDVNLVLGADYYITDGLYLGAEILWGWQTVSIKESTITMSVGGNPAVQAVTPEGSASGFGINNSGIRLGWKF
jgi:hypothetical protein